MATLNTQERHSMGDLTLHILKFSSIDTTDSYNLTNSAGTIAIWGNSNVGVNTLRTLGLSFTNSGTGTTLKMIAGVATTTATVFVLSHG